MLTEEDIVHIMNPKKQKQIILYDVCQDSGERFKNIHTSLRNLIFFLMFFSGIDSFFNCAYYYREKVVGAGTASIFEREKKNAKI